MSIQSITGETANDDLKPGETASKQQTGERATAMRTPFRHRTRTALRQSTSRVPASFPNLLIVGASGHVAQAFLLRLASERHKFGELLLLDQDDDLLRNDFVDHNRLNYKFIRHRLRFPHDTVWYHGMLRRHRISIVLDVTDMDTLPILSATDAAGVSYVNTALNDANQGITDVLALLHPTRHLPRRAPHILSSGMNPGIVNIWVWHGFTRYGVPDEIVHFENDTSMTADMWRPMITWSRKEFLAETASDPTGLVVDGRVRMFLTNALVQRENLQAIMEPVVPMSSYPNGLLVLHEENVQLGLRLGTSSRYIYAIHPQTMTYLTRRWQQRGRLSVGDLDIGDNTALSLNGADTIGVCMKYPHQRVYYLHSMANQDVAGTNATCAQVAVGVHAALLTLLCESLTPRLYFATDLYDTIYRDFIFRHLPVEHFVFAERNRTLLLQEQLSQRQPCFPQSMPSFVTGASTSAFNNKSAASPTVIACPA